MRGEERKQQLRKAGGQRCARGGNSVAWALEVGRCKDGGIFENTSPVGCECPRGAKLYGGPAGGEKRLTGIVRDRARQAKPEELAEGSGLQDGVSTTV